MYRKQRVSSTGNNVFQVQETMCDMYRKQRVSSQETTCDMYRPQRTSATTQKKAVEKLWKNSLSDVQNPLKSLLETMVQTDKKSIIVFAPH